MWAARALEPRELFCSGRALPGTAGGTAPGTLSPPALAFACPRACWGESWWSGNQSGDQWEGSRDPHWKPLPKTLRDGLFTPTRRKTFLTPVLWLKPPQRLPPLTRNGTELRCVAAHHSPYDSMAGNAHDQEQTWDALLLVWPFVFQRKLFAKG